MQPEAKDCWQPPEAERQEEILSGSPRRGVAIETLTLASKIDFRLGATRTKCTVIHRSSHGKLIQLEVFDQDA